MSGRFTGMRHVRIRQDLLTSTSKLMRAGVIEEPGWFKIFQRLPPQIAPPREKYGVPKIVLPTDRLFHIRESKEDSSMPIFAHNELQSSTLLFAQRQLDLMNAGVSEQEAYKQVEESQEAFRAESLAQVSALTASAKEEGASIPLLLSGSAVKHVEGNSPLEQYTLWRERIATTPYNSWEVGQQVMLDHWICKTALAWGWEQERFLFDEDFEEEIAKLRVALFPELCELSHMTPEEREAHEMALEDDAELDELIEVVDWDDDEMNEKMNNWYVTYGKWQTKSFVQSDVKTWDEEDVTELDEWIKSSCLMRSALVGYSEESITDIVLAERHSLFPRLNPEEVKDAPSHDVLPSLSHVRRLVLAHSKIDDVPFILPEDGDYEDDEEGEPISLKRTEADNVTSIDRDAPYQSLPGLSALRSLEARGKALGSDEDNEEEDYYDEEEKEGGDSENAEKEFDEEVAAEFEALQLEIEKKEEKLMHKALREEKWREREAVLELTEEEIEEEWKIQQKQRALAFALPELAKFDTKEFRKRYMTKGGHRNDLKK